MRRSGNRNALSDELARFQDEVRRLAFAVAREIIQQELDRALAKRKATRPARSRPKKRGRPEAAAAAPAAREQPASATTTTERPPSGAAAAEQPASSATAAVEPQPATATGEQPAPPPTPTRSALPTGKRGQWTREAIISELATWILSGTVIDAAFVTRHGPPGLVAAARRVFGRFEAALNVAGLHVSKLYPEGPPRLLS